MGAPPSSVDPRTRRSEDTTISLCTSNPQHRSIITIACTPEDAFRCLMGTEIEVLVVGDCPLRKERQDPALKLDHRNVLDPD
jgi:hypothetical protein